MISLDFFWNFPFFSIIASLFSGVICIFLRGKTARNFTLIARSVCCILSLGTLLYTLQDGGRSVTYMMGHFPAPWGNEIRFGPAETLLAAAFDGVLILSLSGGWRYVERDVDERKRNIYCILFNLIGAALLAMTYTNDLFTGFVFLEILTLTACGILMIRGIGRTTLAAVRYMIMNLLGSGLFLLGIMITYGHTGNLLMVSIHQQLLKMMSEGGDSFPALVATMLMCIGLGLKSGLFPFHFWMPDTYGYATPASSCVLSGVISKGYIILLIKILVRVMGEENPAVASVRHILLILGLGGIIFGSISAITQRRVDRMVAYSSAAQIGYIYVGIGLGGTLGLVAALYHVLVHAFTKPALFLSGARLRESMGGSAYFRELRGSGKKNPFAGAVFAAASFSMIGVPFFAGFVSKFLFGKAALAHSPTVAAVVLTVVALSTILNVVYFLHTVLTIYTPDEKREKEETEKANDHLSEEKGILRRLRRNGAPGRNSTSFLLAGSLFTLANIGLGLMASPIITILARGIELL